MKIRLTPLNIVSAACLVFAAWTLLGDSSPGTGLKADLGWLLAVLGLLAAFIFFISDQLFRKMVPHIGKLWAVQGVLIFFIIVLIFIIKASI